jgi:N-acetylmuramoyl-L-alanine amidase
MFGNLLISLVGAVLSPFKGLTGGNKSPVNAFSGATKSVLPNITIPKIDLPKLSAPFFSIIAPSAASIVNAVGLNNREKDIDILARTMWGEARSEGALGMQAVAHVVMNRLKKSNAGNGYNWGRSITDICLFPWQFSAWNKGDPNRDRMLKVTEADPKFAEAKRIARMVVSGQLADITGGADHYHTTAVKPSWKDANKKTAQIGTHVFYNIA